jgi:chromosome partitioning protein
MRIIACVNQKGGSGKTTTSVNLAATLGERGKRVLLLDLDPQASATNWLGITDAGRGLLDAFSGTAQLLDLVQSTPAPNVDIIGSSAWLLGVDKALAGEVAAETILRTKLRALPEQWDYILIDCAPTLGILTVSGLTATREILIPVEAHVMALSGLAQLINTVAVVRERLNPELEIAGILACRVDGRTKHAAEIVDQLYERFGGLVYRTVIRENVRLAECPSFGQPITLYDSRSAGAQDYRALAEDVDTQTPNYNLELSNSTPDKDKRAPSNSPTTKATTKKTNRSAIVKSAPTKTPKKTILEK